MSRRKKNYFSDHSYRDVKQVYSFAIVEALEQCDVVWFASSVIMC